MKFYRNELHNYKEFTRSSTTFTGVVDVHHYLFNRLVYISKNIFIYNLNTQYITPNALTMFYNLNAEAMQRIAKSNQEKP